MIQSAQEVMNNASELVPSVNTGNSGINSKSMMVYVIIFIILGTLLSTNIMNNKMMIIVAILVFTTLMLMRGNDETAKNNSLAILALILIISLAFISYNTYAKDQNCFSVILDLFNAPFFKPGQRTHGMLTTPISGALQKTVAKITSGTTAPVPTNVPPPPQPPNQSPSDASISTQSCGIKQTATAPSTASGANAPPSCPTQVTALEAAPPSVNYTSNMNATHTATSSGGDARETKTNIPKEKSPHTSGKDFISSPVCNRAQLNAPIKSSKKKEVYNINNNEFTYDEAYLVCKALNGQLATYDQVVQAHRNGANWCNYGWSANGLALFPTQKKHYEKLKRIHGDNCEQICGKPGVNGGFFPNKSLKFGVNCYGPKPLPDKSKITYADDKCTVDKRIVQEYVKKFKEGVIEVRPFNGKKWAKDSFKKSRYIMTPHINEDIIMEEFFNKN